ncbi:hypothetical protein EJ03DRAFT_112532 [Teratosphaeria nubilosa]|uniref:Glycosyl transferase CAP10 domain-containing protein n=1 Tax=Teratosphaeria nubilosa TaxID=161662 RepID=A0A6G1L7K7_9PEZI|nr:hypothetical protein EJ03DRAFT_112532 [Teratosphaeria nubilosa]
MYSLTRRALATTFVAALLVYLTLLAPWRESLKSRSYEPPAKAVEWLPPAARPLRYRWSFDADRDASNTGLTHAQCTLAFPDLYPEIDRAVGYWQRRQHTITPDDIEISWRKDGAVRLLIHENKLRVIESRVFESDNTYGGYSQRTEATLNQIHRALAGARAAGEEIPTIEFAITVEDFNRIPTNESDSHTIWHFARRLIDRDEDRVWVMPDFNFWAAPAAEGVVDFEQTRKLAKERDSPLTEKIPQIIWRGATWTNKARRGSLIDATRDKSWADVMEINWKNKKNMITTKDTCDYMFLAHTEGQTWSGRLKYLLNCNSLAVVHSLSWHTHYYHLLIADGPEQNYISASEDFSNLEQKIEWLLEHPDHAQRVANNSINQFRRKYTTVAAENCYWRRLFHGWASVAFKPDAYETIRGGERVLRGVAVDDFLQAGSHKNDLARAAAKEGPPEG